MHSGHGVTRFVKATSTDVIVPLLPLATIDVDPGVGLITRVPGMARSLLPLGGAEVNAGFVLGFNPPIGRNPPGKDGSPMA